MPRRSPRDPDPCHPPSLTPSMFRAVPHLIPSPPGSQEEPAPQFLLAPQRLCGEQVEDAWLCSAHLPYGAEKPSHSFPGPQASQQQSLCQLKGRSLCSHAPGAWSCPSQPLTAEPGAEQSGETTYPVLYLYFLKRQYTLVTLSLGLHKMHFIKQSRLRQSNPPPPQLSGLKHEGGHGG